MLAVGFIIVGAIVLSLIVSFCSAVDKRAGSASGVLGRILAPIITPIIFLAIGAVIVGLLGLLSY